jgi:hypothetical protein
MLFVADTPRVLETLVSVSKEMEVFSYHHHRGWGSFYSQRMTRELQLPLVRHAFVLNLQLG